jgi:hypothetical protein
MCKISSVFDVSMSFGRSKVSGNFQFRTCGRNEDIETLKVSYQQKPMLVIEINAPGKSGMNLGNNN